MTMLHHGTSALLRSAIERDGLWGRPLCLGPRVVAKSFAVRSALRDERPVGLIVSLEVDEDELMLRRNTSERLGLERVVRGGWIAPDRLTLQEVDARPWRDLHLPDDESWLGNLSEREDIRVASPAAVEFLGHS